MEHPGLTHEEFLAAVELAIHAPSLHNSQPWRFRLTGGAIEVWSDPARQLPIADPTGRAVRQACGAAIFNLRLALASHRHPTEVAYLPDRDVPELLARLNPGPPRPANPDQAAMTAVIRKRHTNRAPFLDSPVPPTHRNQLVAAAEAEHAVLRFVTDRSALAEAAELIRTADATLRKQPGYAEELKAWTRPDSTAPDGVPRHAGGPAPASHELIARRDFGGEPAPEHVRYEAEPLLAILGTYGDSPRDQLIAGQALQHVLLTVTRLGLVASMMSQPIEVPDTRKGIARLIGPAAVPQMVLRIGFGIPGMPTPRRSAQSVVDAAGVRD